MTATEQIAQEIRDRISLCEAALRSAQARILIVSDNVKPEIGRTILKMKERHDTLTECLMLAERE